MNEEEKRVLLRLESDFPYDGDIAVYVGELRVDHKNYDAHYKLRYHLLQNNLVNCDDEYFKIFHYYMYDLVGENKVWYMPGTSIVHRTDKGPDGEVLPAQIHKDGKFYWRIHGALDGKLRVKEGLELPAFVDTKDGTKKWFRCGLCSRCCKIRYNGVVYTLPAVITAEGDMKWYHHGRQHRADLDVNGIALPAVVNADGTKKWFHIGVEYTVEKMTAFLREEYDWKDLTDVEDHTITDMPPEFYEYPMIYIRAKNGHTWEEYIQHMYVLPYSS